MEIVDYSYIDTWDPEELLRALQEAVERRDRAVSDIGVLATELARRDTPEPEWVPPQ